VMAVALVLRNLDHFGFGDVVQQPGLEAAAFEAPAGTSLKTLARAAGMSAAALKQLNPEFLSAIVPDRGSPVALHIPRASLTRARAMLPRLLGGPLHELDEQVSDGFDWGRDTPSADGRNRLELTNAAVNRSDPTELPQRGKPIACSGDMDEKPQLSLAPEDEGPRLSTLGDSLSLPRAISSVDRRVPVDAGVATPQAPDVTFVAYRVARGDTLSKIAKKHGVTEYELVLDNGIRDRSLLFRGQSLQVRDAIASPRRPFLTYKVRSGDTLSAIAMKVQADAQRIAKANGIPDSDLIRVGQVVLISPG
jgi:LysM repeat protein